MWNPQNLIEGPRFVARSETTLNVGLESIGSNENGDFLEDWMTVLLLSCPPTIFWVLKREALQVQSAFPT